MIKVFADQIVAVNTCVVTFQALFSVDLWGSHLFLATTIGSLEVQSFPTTDANTNTERSNNN